MKKTYILMPIGILSLTLGTVFVSAYDATKAIDSQGDLLPIVLSLADTKIDLNQRNSIEKSNNKENNTNEKLNASGTIKVKNNNKSEENENASSSINKNDNEDFEIDGDLERSNDNRGLLISQMAQVHSGGDLHSFVLNLVNKNKDFLNVSSKEDRVSITRDMPTKLFGFIPFSTKETVIVVRYDNGTKKISVSRPWFDLFSKNEIGADIISADIEARLKNIPASELKTALSASMKAYILSEIEASFIANGYAPEIVTP